MSSRSRPVSLRSAIAIRRAQEARRRREESRPAPPARHGFSLAWILGLGRSAAEAEEGQRRMAA